MQTSVTEAPAAGAIHLKQILVPVDFSNPSQQALRYALRFAKEFHAEVTLLHVVEKTAVGSGFADVPSRFAYLDEELSIAKKNLRALTASSQEAGCPTIGSTVRTGLPAHEIVEAAKESNTDLIVIATHGYTGWKHFCIGSTAERVVRAAPCPVFVVREKEHDFV
jgi:universal stress protein A